MNLRNSTLSAASAVVLLSTLASCGEPEPNEPVMTTPTGSNSGPQPTTSIPSTPSASSSGPATVAPSVSGSVPTPSQTSVAPSVTGPTAGPGPVGPTGTGPTATGPTATGPSGSNGGAPPIGPSGAGGMGGMPIATGGAGGMGPGPTNPDAPEPTFETVIEVFNFGCYGAQCHDLEENPMHVDKSDPDDIYEELMSHTVEKCDGAKVVNVDAPDESALVRVLIDGCGEIPRMPPTCGPGEVAPDNPSCIPDDWIQAIRDWIAAGAPR